MSTDGTELAPNGQTGTVIATAKPSQISTNHLVEGHFLVEPARGFEPLTSCLQDRCSTS
jgi:hypothetical protein